MEDEGIQHIVVGAAENKGCFLGCKKPGKVCNMTDGNDRDIFNNTINDGNTIMNDDLLMEEILCNLNNTPLGQVLKKIAALPQGRQKKVMGVRKKLTRGEYLLDHHLDNIVERVLEELED